ncbi:hypothetical protein HZA40_03090 [Candidatus Peregrinibacteria bacterium]|nr:hypothetical protein [Candidatus Peregrinibacteria bacterium]
MLERREITTGLTTAAAEVALVGASLLRRFAKAQVNAVRRRVDSALNGPQKTALDRQIAAALKRAIEFGKSYRLIDKIDLEKTPKLLDDKEADRLLKSDITNDLDNRISIAAPFIEEIQRIGNTCFDRGIPPERLIAFLESEDVLTFLVSEVLFSEDSVYRGDNLKAIGGSIIENVILKLEKKITRTQKEPVDAPTEEKIVKNIAYFEQNYDPHDKTFTITNFIKELEERYPQYDIFSWLIKNRDRLIDLIHGRATEKRHVSDIVNEVYRERGRLSPDRFIELYIDQFLDFYGQEDMADAPAFLFKILGVDRKDAGSVLIFDLKGLGNFFNSVMDKIESKNFNLIQLRSKIIAICIYRIATFPGQIDNLVILHKEGNYKSHQTNNKKSLSEEIEKEINNTCRVISSHVDVRNLLHDPKAISPEIAENFKEWFNEEGELKRHAYYRYLRGLFGQMIARDEEHFNPERFEKLRERVTEIFTLVNEYVASIGEDLKIPSIAIDSVLDVNDYAELVKICCTNINLKTRFATRRKIELAFLIHRCVTSPRVVYQDYEAGAIRKILETASNGIELLDEPTQFLQFLDHPNGQVEEVGDQKTPTDGSKLKAIPLIPAKFGDIKCSLLPTGSADEDGKFDYMGQKSLNSILTNLLNEPNKKIEDMTDLLRMTFVADSLDDLIALQKYLETNYISSGRTLKRENRYGNVVDVDDVSVSTNLSKSSEYRALRYVSYIVIPDEQGGQPYAVPVEIRVLLKEDLMKERSEFNDASHGNYVQTRLQRIMPILAPKEIFHDHYIEPAADPDDVFEQRQVRVKTSKDWGSQHL